MKKLQQASFDFQDTNSQPNQSDFGFEEVLHPTTAIYPNRRADKAIMEDLFGYQEEGNETFSFFTPKGALFAKGYVRMVYGDHGPYLEFKPEHVKCKLVKKFNNKELDPKCYYEWLMLENEPEVKVYDQKRDVKNLPNPPRGGFRGNRKEGYADYKVGMIYVSPYDLMKPKR